MQAGVQPDQLGVAGAAGDIDLGALRRALWRKKFLILGLTLLTAAIAFAGVNFVVPRYKSEARVLLEMHENIFLRPDAEKTTERTTTVDQEAVTSQVQLILSRDLAREVIKKLNLSQRPEFDPVLAGPSFARTVLSLLGIIKDPADMTPEERVFKSYYDRLSAFQVEKSRVIAIEFESQDPELAALAANTIAEVYLRFQQTAKQDQTRAASAWLAGEIERLRGSVAQAEARVEQYRAKTNLFIGNNNTTLSNQQLGDFNAQLATARAQKADAESKAKLIREALKAGTPIEFSDITNSELIRRLSEQRVTLRAQLAEQSSTLLDQHPRIKELRAQIADLERQMRGEADRLARSLENDARVTSSKVEELSSMLDQLKRQAASTNEQDVHLRALERDAKSQRDLLESYLAKYREASARDSIGAAAPDARIISAATVSNTPSWPKKVPIILVAALAMFTLSSAFVVTGELLRTLPPASAAIPVPAGAPTLHSPARRRGIKVEGAAQPDAQAASAGDSDAVLADAVLADAVLAARTAAALRKPAAADPGGGGEIEGVDALARELIDAGEAARRVTVIGALPNVGTTRAAIALARSLAGRSRVVLVELAFAARNLSAIASDPSAAGVAELVEGIASFGDIITRDRHSRAHLIMAGQTAIDPSALVSSQQLAIAIEALGRSYDHVIIDAGAMEGALLDRLAIFAPRAVLVTLDAGGPVTVEARERLLQAGFANVNVIVTAPSNPGVAAGGAKAAA